MPDLTIEYYWMCNHQHDFMSESNNRQEKPECKWQQYYDGDELKNGRCPKCGGNVTSVPYAV